jgi:hypothetical protein
MIKAWTTSFSSLGPYLNPGPQDYALLTSRTDVHFVALHLAISRLLAAVTQLCSTPHQTWTSMSLFRGVGTAKIHQLSFWIHFEFISMYLNPDAHPWGLGKWDSVPLAEVTLTRLDMFVVINFYLLTRSPCSKTDGLLETSGFNVAWHEKWERNVLYR